MKGFCVDIASSIIFSVARNESQLFPCRRLRTPKVEASDRMLLHRGHGKKVAMEPAVVTYHDPISAAYHCQPDIVERIVREAALRTVVVLDVERRLRMRQRLREATTEVAIKVEG